MTELYIGLISGTSVDGLDCVLVDFGEAAPNCLAAVQAPFPEALARDINLLCTTETWPARKLTRVDVGLARLVADTIHKLLNATKLHPGSIAAIGSHGQTVFHDPASDYPTTIQLGDPNVIAELTGITTVADFRRRDMAAGGQGAPLVSAFHQAVFHSTRKNRIILNIGGIANITVLPASDPEAISGFDTGPGNTLLDYWHSKHRDDSCDRGGTWAAQGQVDQALLGRLLNDPWFALPPPKSTGREYFNAAWLQPKLDASLDAQTVQTTLTELTAASIARAISDFAPESDEIIVCGGGIHNDYLISRLTSLTAPRVVLSSADLGVDPDYVEAMAFAWLAREHLQNRPGNRPGVTGARHLVPLGGVYPAGHHHS
jgi:anhydro-N-acetylmuramic acid kinase